MGDYDNLVGELQPGQKGWLPLDEGGYPTGPATLEPPPGPNALACHVMASPADAPEGSDVLVSASGAPLIAPLNSNVDRRVDDGFPDPPHVTFVTLESISPTEAEVGGADITLIATGSGFTEDSVILFNNGEEPTEFIDSSQVSTVVKPSLASGPVSVPVQVREGSTTTPAQTFTFTEAPIARGRRGRG